MKPASIVCVLCLGAMIGCNKETGGSEPAARTPPEAKPAPAAPQKSAPSPAATPAAGDSAPAKTVVPAGRSPAPTLQEWSTMKQEVTVKGSSALGCETKIVREYLRVSCRGKNDSGGTPTTVKVQKGGRGEALAFASGGITSLIVPYVEGIDFEADFSWTDKSHKLVVKWPHRAPKPAVVGVFEGAKSPLDAAAGGNDAKLCDCFKKVMGAASCQEMIGSASTDCDRTYGSDCQALLECARGEPGREPKCLPGFTNWGAVRQCQQDCGPGKPACPAGTECNSDWGPRVCMPQ